MKHVGRTMGLIVAMALVACDSDDGDGGGAATGGAAGGPGATGGGGIGGDATTGGAAGSPTGTGGDGTGGDGTGGGGNEPYVGSWRRTGLSVDGTAHTFCFAQIDLTTTTYHSFTTGGGGSACDCSIEGTVSPGSAPDSLTWTTTSTTGQYCGVLAPGDSYTYTYTVVGDVMTMTTVESGTTIVETYARLDTSGDAILSCDSTATTVATCVDFVGAGIPEAEKTAACTGGVPSTDACRTTNLVGSCVLNQGSDAEVIYRFYSDTTPPFTATQAEQNCGNMSGTFVP